MLCQNTMILYLSLHHFQKFYFTNFNISLTLWSVENDEDKMAIIANLPTQTRQHAEIQFLKLNH